MPSPELSQWQVAKKACFALAGAMPSVTILQRADGGKRVIIGKLIKDFPTWLALWSYLHQIRADQIGVKS